MVSAGSRQALSDASKLPSTGFGEGTLGEAAQSAAVRLPDPATVFLRRAERLAALAEGHELEGFLRLIAALASAQHEAVQALPPGHPPVSLKPAKATLARRPPLDPAECPLDRDWRVALEHILETIDARPLPEQAQQARRALLATPAADLDSLATRYLEGDIGPPEAGKAAFVVAALQAVWTRKAAQLEAASIALGDLGQCPVCGSPPVAGLIAPGGTKFGHRHLHCSLCATAWRHVRVRCVHCGSTDKISFRQLAGTSYLRAECCEACRGYSKVFYLESARIVEPLADDLASLGLDVLVGEEGFSRVPNPFVLGAMSAEH